MTENKFIKVYDIDAQATHLININHIEEITKRDIGSLIVIENGNRIKAEESVSEIAKKIANLL